MTDDMEELKQIGERILAVRRYLHLHQNDFARAMGVSNGSLSMMETGKNQPRFELLFNLAKKYNINFYYLFFGQGEMLLPTNLDTGIKDKKYGPESEYWLREFFHYFNESHLFRFSVMSLVSRYLLENRNLVELDIKNRANPDEK